MSVRAVLFDFGGVILTSPFDAFARYEADTGCPTASPTAQRHRPRHNAWARLERSEVDLEGSASCSRRRRRRPGKRVDGRAVLALLAGELRPEMVEARAAAANASRPPC